MEAILFKLLAFIVAILILVSIHEFGHFWVARKLGVKVLKFSIGFGKPLFTWRGKQDDTEYVLAMIPLGGYVKMLDEREAPVSPEEAARAFNRQSLPVRSAIVIAGPLFNFLFAIAAFWAVSMMGEIGLRPLLGEVSPSSIADKAGFRQGDEIVSINGKVTPTWSIAIQEFASSSIADTAIKVEVLDKSGLLDSREVAAGEIGDIALVKDLLGHLGLEPERPMVPAVIGKVVMGEPAEMAGLKAGDKIVSADDEGMKTWQQWVKYVQARPNEAINLVIDRDGNELSIVLTPKALERGDKVIGRIGAANQPVPGMAERYRVEYSLGAVDAFTAAVSKTGEYSILTLKVMWRIVTGQASVQNLSGPLTIADVAGKTASYGLVHFLKFLAVISISLGVLNLLPIPVLDGGHLLYFAVEAVKGGPIPEEWMVYGQKIGILLLAGLMGIAFYVDITRFFG